MLYSNCMVKQAIKSVLDDTFEALKDQAAHTAKTAVKEPVNIFKSMLGEDVGTSEKAPAAGGAGQQQPGAQLKQLQRTDEVVRQKQLMAVRRQKQYLANQVAWERQRQQEEITEEEKEKQEEEKKEKQQVVQLQKAEEKESVLQQNIKAMEGTKESGPRKQF